MKTGGLGDVPIYSMIIRTRLPLPRLDQFLFSTATACYRLALPLPLQDMQFSRLIKFY